MKKIIKIRSKLQIAYIVVVCIYLAATPFSDITKL